MAPPWRERPQRRTKKSFLLVIFLIFIAAFGGTRWCATNDTAACNTVNYLTSQSSQLFEKAMNSPQVETLRAEVHEKASPYWDPFVEWAGPHVDRASFYATSTYEKLSPVVEKQAKQAKISAIKASHILSEHIKRESPRVREYARKTWIYGHQKSLDLGHFIWIKSEDIIRQIRENWPAWKQAIIENVESLLGSNITDALQPSKFDTENTDTSIASEVVEQPVETAAETTNGDLADTTAEDTATVMQESTSAIETESFSSGGLVSSVESQTTEYDDPEELPTLTLTRTQSESSTQSASPQVLKDEEKWMRRINRTVAGAIQNLEVDVNSTLQELITDARPEIQQALREITQLGDEYIILSADLAKELENGADISPDVVYPQFLEWSNDLAEHALVVRQLAQSLADAAIAAVQSLREVTLEALDDYFDIILSEAGREAASATDNEWDRWRNYHGLKKKVSKVREEAQYYDINMEIANVALRESQQVAVFLVQSCNARLTESRALCQLALQKREEEEQDESSENETDSDETHVPNEEDIKSEHDSTEKGFDDDESSPLQDEHENAHESG